MTNFPLPPYRYAQTAPQLLNELRAQGRAEEEQVRAHLAHQLAMRLFAERFRSNHKPFICHLIGTASILAAHGADMDVVIAGLMHAAYEQGEFGDTRRGITDSHQALVRSVIGERAEKILAIYTRLDWRTGAIDPEALSMLEPLNRDALFIRACNELEDMLDLSPLYSSTDKREHVMATIDLAVAVARGLNQNGVADEIEVERSRVNDSSVPTALVSTYPGSYILHSIALRQRIWQAVVWKFKKLFGR